MLGVVQHADPNATGSASTIRWCRGSVSDLVGDNGVDGFRLGTAVVIAGIALFESALCDCFESVRIAVGLRRSAAGLCEVDAIHKVMPLLGAINVKFA